MEQSGISCILARMMEKMTEGYETVQPLIRGFLVWELENSISEPEHFGRDVGRV